VDEKMDCLGMDLLHVCAHYLQRYTNLFLRHVHYEPEDKRRKLAVKIGNNTKLVRSWASDTCYCLHYDNRQETGKQNQRIAKR